MGTVQGSGAISLANLQSNLGGANPISLSEYYRGGGYVPSTRTITTSTREPSSSEYGELRNGNDGYTTYYRYCMLASNVNSQPVPNSGPSTLTSTSRGIWWGGSYLIAFPSGANYSSYTSGGTTYYRGAQIWSFTDSYGGWAYVYRIYRYISSSSTSSINTAVPSSGQISLSQLYGATSS